MSLAAPEFGESLRNGDASKTGETANPDPTTQTPTGTSGKRDDIYAQIHARLASEEDGALLGLELGAELDEVVHVRHQLEHGPGRA